MVILCMILISKHNKKNKKKTPKKEVKEVNAEDTKTFVTTSEDKVEFSDNKVVTHTRSEAYLEKTIRFRRVCPKCGSVNVLTNDKCYLCGEKLNKL